VSPDYDVELLDDNDEPVPDGTAGEIAIRPKAPFTMFTEYYNNPVATATAWRNGWFHTGDLGRRGADGYYSFVDRKKDYIRRRGENISSFEVETALQTYPDIAEIAAFGVPSELGEDEVKVCVVLQPGAELDYARFMDFCVESLPYYAVPRYVEVCEALPRNQTGRVLKPTLRERGIGDSWDRDAVGYVVSRT
jgi:crotonobetaine/carnitine-CoA ligase